MYKYRNTEVCINEKYNYDNRRLNNLLSGLYSSLNSFEGVIVVRMDFGLSNDIMNDIDVPRVGIFNCFDEFINRLRRKRVGGQLVSFIMNYKKEWSEKKGDHIHTVFYFDRKQFPAFTPNTTIFKAFEELWTYCTRDNSLPAGGYINIIPSYLSESEGYYRAEPNMTSDNPDYHKKHYYTILMRDTNTEAYRELEDYHKQKHYFQYPCGLTHWISYLAKDEQEASVRKRFGAVANAIPKSALLI